MRTIKVFKITGEIYRTFDDPKSYTIDKATALLTVTQKCPDGSTEVIKTTLPFFLEEDAPKPEATTS